MGICATLKKNYTIDMNNLRNELFHVIANMLNAAKKMDIIKPNAPFFSKTSEIVQNMIDANGSGNDLDSLLKRFIRNIHLLQEMKIDTSSKKVILEMACIIVKVDLLQPICHDMQQAKFVHFKKKIHKKMWMSFENDRHRLNCLVALLKI
jgi:hypothetical protein